MEHVGGVYAARDEVRAGQKFEFTRQKIFENSSADSPIDLNI